MAVWCFMFELLSVHMFVDTVVCRGSKVMHFGPATVTWNGQVWTK